MNADTYKEAKHLNDTIRRLDSELHDWEGFNPSSMKLGRAHRDSDTFFDLSTGNVPMVVVESFRLAVINSLKALRAECVSKFEKL